MSEEHTFFTATSADDVPGRNLFDLIIALNKRAGLFIHEPNINYLEVYLNGWIDGKAENDNYRIMRGFDLYLEHLYGLPIEKGWASNILENSVSPEAAFAEFFTLFREYAVIAKSRFTHSMESVNKVGH